MSATAYSQPPAKVRLGHPVSITNQVLTAGASDTIRFGRVNKGDVAVRTVTLYNDSDKPFSVVSHQNSCGCTSFRYSRKPVKPGEHTDIVCSFDSRDAQGWQMKLAKFYLSGTKKPIRIFIDAEVE